MAYIQEFKAGRSGRIAIQELPPDKDGYILACYGDGGKLMWQVPASADLLHDIIYAAQAILAEVPDAGAEDGHF